MLFRKKTRLHTPIQMDWKPLKNPKNINLMLFRKERLFHTPIPRFHTLIDWNTLKRQKKLNIMRKERRFLTLMDRNPLKKPKNYNVMLFRQERWFHTLMNRQPLKEIFLTLSLAVLGTLCKCNFSQLSLQTWRVTWIEGLLVIIYQDFWMRVLKLMNSKWTSPFINYSNRIISKVEPRFLMTKWLSQPVKQEIYLPVINLKRSPVRSKRIPLRTTRLNYWTHLRY